MFNMRTKEMTFSAKQYEKENGLDFGDDGKKPGGFAPQMENKWQKREMFKDAPLTTEQRIAWNSSINNAVPTLGILRSYEKFSDGELQTIYDRAKQIYKLITEGPK